MPYYNYHVHILKINSNILSIINIYVVYVSITVIQFQNEKTDLTIFFNYSFSNTTEWGVSRHCSVYVQIIVTPIKYNDTTKFKNSFMNFKSTSTLIILLDMKIDDGGNNWCFVKFKAVWK